MLDQDRLRAYEALWLLRDFSFESAKRSFESAKREESEVRPTDASWQRHDPPPAAYEDDLRDL